METSRKSYGGLLDEMLYKYIGKNFNAFAADLNNALKLLLYNPKDLRMRIF
jgi:hypothetical protein